MTYTAQKYNTQRAPCEPAVLGPIRVGPRSSSNTDIAVYIPWKHCRLVYAYAMIAVIPTTADQVIDIELNAKSGTVMGSITITESGSAVGDVVDAVLVPEACNNLDRDDTTKQMINLEIVAHTSGVGTADVYLYFESENMA